MTVMAGGYLREVRLAGVDGGEPSLSRWSGSGWWDGFADPLTASYAAIYRTQRWVRTAVDYLADNAAQVPLHAYRRLSDDDRVRLRSPDHPFAAVLTAPDPAAQPPLTQQWLVKGLMSDLRVYGNAFAAKLADRNQGRQLRLRRLVPGWLTEARTLAGQEPGFEYYAPGAPPLRLAVGDLLWVRLWSPERNEGESPIEPLRQMLWEEWEAQGYRGQMWRQGARMSGIITRPHDAPAWSSDERERFRSDWRGSYAGAGSDAGGTPLLEDGMSFASQVFTAEQAQYLQTRELTREEVAAAFHIPPTLQGMTKGATYSNTREHHLMLYQDVLGPDFRLLESEVMAQLLPDLVSDNEGVYCEFNVAAKLELSFDEQARALQTAVGAPWMTRAEARARMNLPHIEGADGLVVPLNVLVGGLASPTDTAPKGNGQVHLRELPRLVAAKAAYDAELDAEQAVMAQRIAEFYRRQGVEVVAALSAGAALAQAWDGERWDAELLDELLRTSLPLSGTAARAILDLYAPADLDFTDELFVPPLTAYAEGAAGGINATSLDAIATAWSEGGDWLPVVAGLFVTWAATRALDNAATAATYAVNLGRHDAARAVGLRGKTWRVTSSNPRPSHAAMDGERVPIGDVFSNGARWPGDPTLDVDERVNCNCRLDFDTEG